MKNETRSMIGLLYVLKDEICTACAGSGKFTLKQQGTGETFDFACHVCNGKGFRTFKIELSAALKQIAHLT